MKYLKLNLLGLPLLALWLSGCATTNTDTWADATRKTVHSAVLVVDQFLIYETAHRATIGTNVTAIADQMRDAVPPLVRTIRAGLDAYDLLATPALQTQVNGQVVKLQTYSTTAATLVK